MLKKTSKLLERLRNHLNLVPRNHDIEYEVKRSIGVFANLDIRVFVDPALWPTKFSDEYWSDSSRDVLNAGYDLRACAVRKGTIKSSNNFELTTIRDGRVGWLLLPYQMYSVDTGVVFEIPEGFYGAVSLRSSIFQSGIAMPSEGKVDASYRGHVWVTIRYVPNLYTSSKAGTLKVVPIGRLVTDNQREDDNNFFLGYHDRFAQLIVQPYLKQHIVCVPSQDDLTVTNRGDGGFGSTGRQ
jgi:dUTPase